MAGAMLVLPFLPMLPTQILLNNFLYDVAQVAIPTDRVDEAFVRVPRKWDIAMIRRLMVLLGPLSSAYDFLTFWALIRVFDATEAQFHTGWFVESLATQTLVIFVIRTTGNPLRSRPSAPLLAAALGVVALGVALPWTPFGAAFGFVPLPPAFFAFVAAAAGTYLALVAVVRARVLRER
jgi:Mg2+-importing ATPase